MFVKDWMIVALHEGITERPGFSSLQSTHQLQRSQTFIHNSVISSFRTLLYTQNKLCRITDIFGCCETAPIVQLSLHHYTISVQQRPLDEVILLDYTEDKKSNMMTTFETQNRTHYKKMSNFSLKNKELKNLESSLVLCQNTTIYHLKCSFK